MGYLNWLKKEKLAREYILGLGAGAGFYFFQIYLDFKWASFWAQLIGAFVMILILTILYFAITLLAYFFTERPISSSQGKKKR